MSIRYPYPEFAFYGASVYQELGSEGTSIYFSSSGVADVNVTHIDVNQIHNPSLNQSSPFQFTASLRNNHQTFDIQNVELFFYAPATCKQENQKKSNAPPFLMKRKKI